MNWNLVTLDELDAAGISPRTRRRLRRDGALTSMFPNVYRVGDVPANRERAWLQQVAALTARTAPDGVVADACAAALLGLDGFDRPQPVSVAVPLRSGMRPPGTRRRRLLLAPGRHEGLPVTSIPDLLIDLGAVNPGVERQSWTPPNNFTVRTSEDLVELAVEAALRRGLTTINAVAEALADVSNQRPGRGVVRAVLARRPSDAAPTESCLETITIQLCRHGGLPEPERQVTIRNRSGAFIGRVDLLFGRRLVVELDGWDTHRERFDEDRARWDDLTAAGYSVLVFTWKQVVERESWVLDRIRHALLDAAA